MWIQKVPGGGVLHLTYSPDGQTLYTLDTSGLLTAWDVGTHTPRRLVQFPGQSWDFRGLHTLTDGRLVNQSRLVSLLDPSGKVITETDLTFRSSGHERIRPDGRVYFLAIDLGSVGVWDLGRAAPVPGFPIPSVAGYLSRPQCFDISSDDRLVAVSFDNNSPALVFERTTEGELRNPVPVAGCSGAYWARFSPDGRRLILVSGYPQGIAIWNVEDRSRVAARIACWNPDRVLAFHPTAPLFAALNADRVLTLFSLDTGDPIRSLDFALGRYVQDVAFAPDGLTCAVGGSNKQFAVFDVDV